MSATGSSEQYHELEKHAHTEQPHEPDQSLEPKKSILDLAPELRNQIYRYALVEEDSDEIVLRWSEPTVPGLIDTNRQIRAEALPIYYAENNFLAECTQIAVNFLSKASPLKLQSLKSLQIFPDPIEATSFEYFRNKLDAIWKSHEKEGLGDDVLRIEMEVYGEGDVQVTLRQMENEYRRTKTARTGKYDVIIRKKRGMKN